jgi:hypothetical protein
VVVFCFLASYGEIVWGGDVAKGGVESFGLANVAEEGGNAFVFAHQASPGLVGRL